MADFWSDPMNLFPTLILVVIAACIGLVLFKSRSRTPEDQQRAWEREMREAIRPERKI